VIEKAGCLYNNFVNFISLRSLRKNAYDQIVIPQPVIRDFSFSADGGVQFSLPRRSPHICADPNRFP
jgi:hypothetical protein